MFATPGDLADYMHEPSIIDNPQAHRFVDMANEWVRARISGFNPDDPGHTEAAKRAVCALAAEWLASWPGSGLKRYRAGEVEMEYRDEVSGWGVMTALTELKDAGLWSCCKEVR